MDPRPTRRAALAAAVLALLPGAAAWGNDAIEEPSSVHDRREWMWPTANDRTQLVAGELRDRLYFNVQLTVEGIAAMPQAPGGRASPVLVAATGLLGYWRDCNNDGYVGNRATGQLRYLAPGAAVDLAVCPPGSAFNPGTGASTGPVWGRIGPMIHEMIHVGSHRGYLDTTPIPYSIRDEAARVWGDVGRPEERAFQSAHGYLLSTTVAGETPFGLVGGLTVTADPDAACDVVPCAAPDAALDALALRAGPPTAAPKRSNDFSLAPFPPFQEPRNSLWPWTLAGLNGAVGGWYSEQSQIMNATEARGARFFTFYARVGAAGLNGLNHGPPTFRAPGPSGLPGARLARGEWAAPTFVYGEEACREPRATGWDCAAFPSGPFPAWTAARPTWGVDLAERYHMRDTDCIDYTPAAPDVAAEARANANYAWDYALRTASGDAADAAGPLLEEACA